MPRYRRNAAAGSSCRIWWLRIPCRARRSRDLGCPSALVLRDLDSGTNRTGRPRPSLPPRPTPATATSTYTNYVSRPRHRRLGAGARMPHRGHSCASMAAAGLRSLGGLYGPDGSTRGGGRRRALHRAIPGSEKPHQQRLLWLAPWLLVVLLTGHPIPDGPEGKVKPCLKAVSPGGSKPKGKKKR